jgi:hypothetical protein
MGSMRVLTHPPVVITGGRSKEGGALTSYLHGALWLMVEVAEWGIRREAHVHAVRPLGGGEWRPVDLSRHALSPSSWEPVRPPSAEIAAELVAWFQGRPLRLYRLPALDSVSELGETPDDFRRRMLGLLRPELEERSRSLRSRPVSVWPWRRRAERARRERFKHSIAGEIGELVAEVEEWLSPDPTSVIRRLEVGVMLVGEGIALAAPARKDLMA